MSATLDRDSDPERPSRASSSIDPVQDEHSDVTTVPTAIAEPDPAQPDSTVSAERHGASASSSSMIVLQDVRKVYEPNVTALDGVSFVIEKGEFVFVVGASGSGKSTIIRLLLKELEPTSGRILGCVFQDFKLLPNRSAADNVAYALRVQGEGSSSIRRKVPEVLNLVGLA